jgi:hypothetical protein
VKLRHADGAGPLLLPLPSVELMGFFDSELLELPDESFAQLLESLENSRAHVPVHQKSEPLDDYLAIVRKVRDSNQDRDIVNPCARA